MSIQFTDIDPKVPTAGEILLTLRCSFADFRRERLGVNSELEEEWRAGTKHSILHSIDTLAKNYPDELIGVVDRLVEQFSKPSAGALSKHDFGEILIGLINSGAPIKGRVDLFTLNPCKGHQSDGMHILDYVTYTSADHTGWPTNQDVLAATRRLIEECDLHPDSVTNEGRTPLAMTSRNQNIAMLEYLLQAGAEPNPVDPRTNESFEGTLDRLGLYQMASLVKATKARTAVFSVIDQARNRNTASGERP